MMAAKTVKKELLNDDIKVEEKELMTCANRFSVIHSVKEERNLIFTQC
jgi:hypothetical protein